MGYTRYVCVCMCATQIIKYVYYFVEKLIPKAAIEMNDYLLFILYDH